LNELKVLAEKNYGGFVSRLELQRKRDEFEKLKYRLLPFKRNTSCHCCNNLATIRHHIQPLVKGGSNSKKNLVPVCSSCHEYIHPFMYAFAQDNSLQVAIEFDNELERRKV
jgi:HNH endonuclease